MNSFDLLDALQSFLSQHEGGILREEIHNAVAAMTSPKPTSTSIDSAINLLIDIGDLSPAIKNRGKTIYLWHGKAFHPSLPD